MEIFNWEPLQGSTEGLDEKIKRVQFGDGYDQVEPDGLNSIRRVFEGLQFKSADLTQEQEIRAFYLRHGRSKPFRLETTRYSAIVRFDSELSITKASGIKHLTISMKEVFR